MSQTLSGLFLVGALNNKSTQFKDKRKEVHAKHFGRIFRDWAGATNLSCLWVLLANGLVRRA